MTDDLRRLAEQATPGPWKYPVGGAVIQEPNGPSIVFGEMATEDGAYIAAANPQTILALLDERDQSLRLMAGELDARLAAERRVAALEELLREIVIEYPALDPKHPWAGFVDKARALLAAIPSASDD